MNSDSSVLFPVPNQSSGNFRKIQLLFALLIVALVIPWFLPASWKLDRVAVLLSVLLMPALLYAVAVLRYGRVIFGPAATPGRERAWFRWHWTGAILFGLPYPVIAMFLAIFDKEEAPEAAPNLFFYTFKVLCFMLPALVYGWVGAAAFLRSNSVHARPADSSRRWMVLSLVAGSLLIFASLALDIDYETHGWRVLAVQAPWVTNEFVEVAAVRPWFDAMFLVFYASAILLALASVAVAGRVLMGKSLSSRQSTRMLDGALVVLWFMLANYFGNCLYVVYVGVFSIGGHSTAFVLITMLWLALFLAGVFLWFRFSRRTGFHAEQGMVGLVVFAGPWMLVPFSTFWILAVFELYGLAAFLAGVEILAACYWKMARMPRPAS